MRRRVICVGLPEAIAPRSASHTWRIGRRSSRLSVGQAGQSRRYYSHAVAAEPALVVQPTLFPLAFPLDSLSLRSHPSCRALVRTISTIGPCLLDESMDELP